MTPKRTPHTASRTARRPPPGSRPKTITVPRRRTPAPTPPPGLEVAEQLAKLTEATDLLADECRQLGTRIAAAERELLALRPGSAPIDVPPDVVPGA